MSKQKGYYLDEETWGELGRLSAKKQILISEIIELYVKKGLAHELDLTPRERYHASEQCIISSLDSHLKTFGVVVDGDLNKKFDILCSLTTGISAVSPLRHLRRIAELGIFEILEEIKSWDNDRFEDIKKDMGRFRLLRQEYLSLYPEKK